MAAAWARASTEEQQSNRNVKKDPHISVVLDLI